jgi:hypothetical protein
MKKETEKLSEKQLDKEQKRENYRSYYYYHHRISHFSTLAGKHSPILGISNQQD